LDGSRHHGFTQDQEQAEVNKTSLFTANTVKLKNAVDELKEISGTTQEPYTQYEEKLDL
jgi:hypothetical protein